MPEQRRRRRRLSRETVGNLKLTYKEGVAGPDLPGGVVRQVDLQMLRSEMPKFRVPGQRGESGRRPKATVTITFYRTRGGEPGLTPLRSATLRPADLTDAELTNTFEVDVPDLS